MRVAGTIVSLGTSYTFTETTGYTTTLSTGGPGSNVTITLPSSTGTLAALGLANSWTAANTFTGAISRFSRADATPSGTAETTADDVVIGSTDTANTGLSILASTSGVSRIHFGDTDTDVGKILYNHTSDFIQFVTATADQVKIDATGLNVQNYDGASVGLRLAGALVTSSAAELNMLDGLSGAVLTTTSTSTLTNKTLTAPDVTSGSYINLLGQATIRFNDDSGGDYVAVKASASTTTHTLLLPATQGASSSVLTNDGSGNLSWASALTSTLAQYNVFIGNASSTSTATDTNAAGDILASTTGGLTIKAGAIVNADVNSSAAIVYSKLSLSDSIVNADINSAAAIAYSKLSLSNSILNADINSSAAIVYSKLSLSNSILNADINSAAAIDSTKLNLTTTKTDNLIINDATTATKEVDFAISGATASTKTTLTFAQTANRTITYPDATTTLVGTDTTQTLSNKTLTAPSLTGTMGISGTPIFSLGANGALDFTSSNAGATWSFLSSAADSTPTVLIGNDATNWLFRVDGGTSDTFLLRNSTSNVNFFRANTSGEAVIAPGTSGTIRSGATLTVRGSTTAGSGASLRGEDLSGTKTFQVVDDGGIDILITNWGSSATQDVGASATTGSARLEKFTSSRRFKTNIRNLEFSPADILRLSARQYERIMDKSPVTLKEGEQYKGVEELRNKQARPVRQEFGWIAEEVAEILPQLTVFEHTHDGVLIRDDKGQPVPYSVDYKTAAVLLNEVVKDLVARVEALESR